MIKLNLGSGISVANGFINIDKHYTESQVVKEVGNLKKGTTYIQADIMKLPFEDNYADYAEAVDVMEHLPIREVIKGMKEIFRVLKPGAKFIWFSPNSIGVATQLIRTELLTEFDNMTYNTLSMIMYGNQITNDELHRVIITPKTAGYYTSQAGFENIEVTGLDKDMPLSELPKLQTTKPSPDGKLIIDYLYVKGVKP